MSGYRSNWSRDRPRAHVITLANSNCNIWWQKMQSYMRHFFPSLMYLNGLISSHNYIEEQATSKNMIHSTYRFLKTFSRLWTRIFALHIHSFIYLCSFLKYSYFTLYGNHIPAAMATFTEDDCIYILQLKRAENYRPWAIYVPAALKSRRVWDIVLGTQVASAAP